MIWPQSGPKEEPWPWVRSIPKRGETAGTSAASGYSGVEDGIMEKFFIPLALGGTRVGGHAGDGSAER
jgi:hypothetical protein